ncbi:MAG: OST-HTH/LOTUS domain-containing protein, partial [Deltaproteobacteria bacterium]|nr:OST-HTH/LOTUS domain-containing protein [Deltaproteobacteria bacterium]
NYGFSKLSEMITAIGLFELERRENRVYVRDARKKTKPCS